jgi:hypothetical protein
MLILRLDSGDFMARIVTKKAQLHDEALQLYLELDARFRPVHTLVDIADKVGLDIRTVRTKAYEGPTPWKTLRDEAITKARDTAAAKSLALRDARARARAKKIAIVVENLADIIYEIREYNHFMFTQLMATRRKKGDKDTKSSKAIKTFKRLALPPDSRVEVHRAWMDSLSKLFELFGVNTVKELAAEMLTARAAAAIQNSQQPAQHPPAASAAVNITLNTGAPPAPADDGGVHIDDRGYEYIMSAMAGEGKIGGPVNYTGPKETSIVEGVEDAVVTSKERPDSEG